MSNPADLNLRDLDGRDTYKLRPGDENWRSYVGPPSQYDVMGATQFSLLTFLGMREGHRVLDFGCGSLRAGRFLIPFLLPTNYYGLEPNKWLIEDSIAKHIGNDQILLKKPNFFHNDDFTIDNIEAEFDFIVAQSIFSHTGSDLVGKVLASFGRKLAKDGLVVATFIHSAAGQPDFDGAGWIYPECVTFTSQSVEAFFRQASMNAVRMNWFHPRQTWYVGAKSAVALERAKQMANNPGFKFE